VTPSVTGIDAGLLRRFREAEARIAWRNGPAAPKRPAGRRVRVAHLHEEEARVESWGTPRAGGLEVDSGPVGALVLVLETARRGAVPLLTTVEAGEDPAFPEGAIVARWGPRASSPTRGPRLHDLVELARYALA
jgi:hypothetical protein